MQPGWSTAEERLRATRRRSSVLRARWSMSSSPLALRHEVEGKRTLDHHEPPLLASSWCSKWSTLPGCSRMVERSAFMVNSWRTRHFQPRAHRAQWPTALPTFALNAPLVEGHHRLTEPKEEPTDSVMGAA